ncbi:ESCO1/2 acetyl-transferase domain containing protein [Elaphomyces granulatus]
MKTYGRPMRHVFDDDDDDDDRYPAQKKRRVLSADDSDNAETSLQYAIRESSTAVLSSPSRRNSVIYSEETPDVYDREDDDDDRLSTPPSSPPPPPRLTPPPVSTRKPTFSFLKRKRSSPKDLGNGSPLTEVNSNSVRSSTDPPPKKPQPPPPVLRQMQLDLGTVVRKSCTSCGMEYVPSNAEDADLHRKYHDRNSAGIDLGKAFVKANASRWVYEAARFDEGYVVIVDRKSSPAAKSQAKKVLEVVNRELCSPKIEDPVLWGPAEPPKRLRKNGRKEETDRFKVFLHMKESKCVGLCLTERIWEARPVKLLPSHGRNGDGPSRPTSSSITMGEDVHPAIVGVSRIWTSGAWRRKGIAMDLLDCVVSNFIYGMDIPKDQIAFTQPTDSGCRLAEAFFGVGEPWHVYVAYVQ